MNAETRLYYRNYYAANRARIRTAQNKRYNESLDLREKAKQRFDKNREKRYAYYVMDFDHRDPALKTASVSYIARNTHNLDVVQAEIDKCDLVCANCHRIRTHLKKQSRTKKYAIQN